MKLAGRCALRTVRIAINDQTTHTADTLAAIGIESHGLCPLGEKLFVENVKHLQERGIAINIIQLVFLEMTLVFRAILTPVFDCDSHL